MQKLRNYKDMANTQEKIRDPHKTNSELDSLEYTIADSKLSAEVAEIRAIHKRLSGMGV